MARDLVEGTGVRESTSNRGGSSVVECATGVMATWSMTILKTAEWDQREFNQIYIII